MKQLLDFLDGADEDNVLVWASEGFYDPEYMVRLDDVHLLIKIARVLGRQDAARIRAEADPCKSNLDAIKYLDSTMELLMKQLSK